MSTRPWMIYGAYGYSGELIAREAVARGETPILAGRRPEPLSQLGSELDLEIRPFQLETSPILERQFADVELVLHCAGPFASTFRSVSEACLRTGTHYLDITGEIDVFESLARRHRQAQEAKVVVMPGVGFDVVPSDCLAVHAGELFSQRYGTRGQRLTLGLMGLDETSRGTALTMIDQLGQGGRVRRDGELVGVPMGTPERLLDFGEGPTLCMAIPWGDLATAYRSTGIPNIEVYIPVSPARRAGVKMVRSLGPLLRLGVTRALLRSRVKAGGPTEESRARTRVLLMAIVEGDEGKVSSTVHTPDGYTFTARSSVECVRRILAGEVEAGSWTPAQALGTEWVTRLEGVGEYQDAAG